jgi:NAD-dependent SIR2 family protein deacetylase
VTVLTGAGVSTGSGIPDYRDENGDWKHAQPMQFGEFAGSENARRRYWARSYVGWQRFGSARPNAAHTALATLESFGKVDTLVSQNVDGLHARAGSRTVIDLHGDLSRVRCLDCDTAMARKAFQSAMQVENAEWHADVFRYRPDGDAELAADNHADFRVPGCPACDGTLKPDVVMFGESVPAARVESAMAAVDRSDALLVVGSSLMVFSGYRFARRAAEQDKPVAIVNKGRTRADDVASVKVSADCADVLPSIVADLGS